MKLDSLFLISSLRYRIKSNKIGFVIFDKNIDDPRNITVIDNGVISELLSKFYRCLCKKSPKDDVATIIKLSELDSNYFCNGDRVAHSRLVNNYIDVMVHFPEFWYKGVNLPGNKYMYCFSLDKIHDYNHACESLVGAYKGYVKDDKLRSISGVLRSTSIFYNDFVKYSRNRGDGFHLINYIQHKTIAWMFYSKYKTRDSQSVCGRGINKYSGVSNGTTNILGMRDTTPNDSNILVNFLGIEGCWGYIYEFIEGLYSDSNHGVIALDSQTDCKGRLIIDNKLFPNGYSGWVSEMYDGDHMDLVPKSTNDEDGKEYCDYGYVYPSSTRVFTRSYSSAYSSGGVSYLYGGWYSGNSSSNVGSRLAYTGKIRETDDVSLFKV